MVPLQCFRASVLPPFWQAGYSGSLLTAAPRPKGSLSWSRRTALQRQKRSRGGGGGGSTGVPYLRLNHYKPRPQCTISSPPSCRGTGRDLRLQWEAPIEHGCQQIVFARGNRLRNAGVGARGIPNCQVREGMAAYGQEWIEGGVSAERAHST